MNDLFARLAGRALGIAAPSIDAEADADLDISDGDELTIAEAPAAGDKLVASGDPTAPSLADGAARHPTGEPAERPAVAARLVPMPSFVPPTHAGRDPFDLDDVPHHDGRGDDRTSAASVGARGIPGQVLHPTSIVVPAPAVPAGNLHPPPAHVDTDVAAPAAPASPPAVHVTIGRIDVRVRPPARADTDRRRQPVGPPPALSLDEYLRRRERGS